MNPILAVGSVALDSVQTPEGESKDALGGSAVYFSLAARQFTSVKIVGVVGEDFPEEHRSMLSGLDIDVSGLRSVPGHTFRWEGRFDKKFDQAQTLATHLNVFEKFRPVLDEGQSACPVLFLGNIDPELQLDVLGQMKNAHLVAADTMNFWISSKKPALQELLGKVDVLFINEEEAAQLTGETNNVRAARRLGECGPSVVVVKKGEHGALLLAGGDVYPFPAFPVESVKDPTGAGDSFAGGFMGYLSSCMDLGDVYALKRAVAYGAVTASFNVESFSTGRLEKLDRKTLDARQRAYIDLLSIAGEPAAV